MSSSLRIPGLTPRIFVTAAIVLTIATSAPAQNGKLSEQERADLRHVLQHATSGEDLDLRVPQNYRFMVRQFERSGHTRARYPQLFKSLDSLRESGPQPFRASARELKTEPLNMIVEIKTSDQIHFETEALSSIPHGSEALFLTLGLYDEDDEPIGRLESVNDFLGGYDVILNATGVLTTASTSPRLVKSVGSYFYEDESGGHHGGSLKESTASIPKHIEHLAPKVITNPNRITVCLNRTKQNPNGCDYDCSNGLNCARQPASDWDVRFPVQGYIDYEKNIDIDPNTGKPVGAVSRIVTVFTKSGGACKLPLGSLFDSPNTKVVNQNRLEWDLNPAVFGEACYPGTQDVTYAFMVSVVTEGRQVSAFINNASETPAESTVKLKPMKIIQGCLAPGSNVTLADGTEQVIEKFDGNEKVRSRGKTLTVAGTTYGRESKPLVRIDAGGASLAMTDGHPVPTTAGMKLARELKVGDRVYMAGGTERITSVKREPYSGKVYNLAVGTAADGVTLTDSNRTFYANGILVGDAEMQGYWERLVEQRDVRKTLPKRWAVDFRSAQQNAARPERR